ncbi:hypothetical protein CANCADRAFT_46320 [Tortispora caseinolytica NRRL Y-17796]|uniref:Uncharacterized protein n=1 Tax=Tortispora caseinolytica NRRL Y-17796 TaxID=767744 RepID=A0A1E4T9H9_9ASCO|nr:hypothetical protein CANCADRAFT_46320 [Tortispora caseinolytica NRRL Y-17796]
MQKATRSVNNLIQPLLNARLKESRPLIVGLHDPSNVLGPQIVRDLSRTLDNAVYLDLDEFCMPKANLQRLYASLPDNQLIQSPGFIGTHDIDMCLMTLRALDDLKQGTLPRIAVPRFSRPTHKDPYGNRLNIASWTSIESADIVFVRSWFMGYPAIDPTDIEEWYTDTLQGVRRSPFRATPIDPSAASLESYCMVNSFLSEYVSLLYPRFDALVSTEPIAYSSIYAWLLGAKWTASHPSDQWQYAFKRLNTQMALHSLYLPHLRKRPPILPHLRLSFTTQQSFYAQQLVREPSHDVPAERHELQSAVM